MKLIHEGGFPAKERKGWKNIIFHNLVDAFLLIFDILEHLGDHVQDSRSEVSFLVFSTGIDGSQSISIGTYHVVEPRKRHRRGRGYTR